MEAKGKTKKAAKLAPPPGAVVDSEKLGQQLAAVKVLDIDALGHLVGKETLDAVLSGKDAPSADAALPAVGDVGADAARIDAPICPQDESLGAILRLQQMDDPLQ